MTSLSFNSPVINNLPKNYDYTPVVRNSISGDEFDDALSHHSTLAGKINQIADDYFSFSSVCYAKTNFYEEDSRVVTPIRVQRSFFGSFVKVLSYFTVIIPIYMLFHKLIYRATLDYKVRSTGEVEQKILARKGPQLPPPSPQASRQTIFDQFHQTTNETRTNRKPQEPVRTRLRRPSIGQASVLGIHETHHGLQVDTEIGLRKKPVKLTIDASNIPSTVLITDLTTTARSLGISGAYLNNLAWLQDRLRGQLHRDLTLENSRTYLRAIMHLFSTTSVSKEITKEVLTNIGRDCGVGTCDPGILTKIQKEYSRLLGAGEDDVEQIFLREIDDLKLEKLNVIANDYTSSCWHPHFISAAQVNLSTELGLNADAGRLDEYYNSEEVFRHFSNPRKKQAVVQNFLMGYTPDNIITYLHGKISGAKDEHGITLHIQAYKEFILDAIKKKHYPMPSSLEELESGPLKEYVDKAKEDYTDLDELYDEVIDKFVTDKFFVYNEDFCCETGIKEAGTIFVLKEIQVLK